MVFYDIIMIMIGIRPIKIVVQYQLIITLVDTLFMYVRYRAK